MNQADVSPSQSAPTQRWDTRGPVALVYSAHAGAARGDSPQALLERAGVAVAHSLPVEALDASEPLGQRWRAAGCVAAIAAGGDGTVGAVATHAVGADLPLGVLPLGTANDIARALGIPLAPADAARVIAQGALQPIDAGQAVPSQTQPHAATHQAMPSEALLDAALAGAASPSGLSSGQPARGGAYFLHALTLGLNVEFARLATDVTQRRLWGRFTYIASAIASLERLQPIPVTLRFIGMSGAPEQSVFIVQSETTLFTAINLPVFGGRLGLRVPGIRADDRLLDFIMVEAPDPRGARVAFETALGALTRAAQALWAPRGGGAGAADATASESMRLHPVQNPAGVALPGARWFRARAVEIETEQPVELTLDGELRGRTPAVARVAPSAVRMIVPAR